MVNKLKNYENTKKEIEKLQLYIDLIDNYEIKNIKNWIIKQYAISNSIAKVISKSRQSNITDNDNPLSREFIVRIINGEVEKGDELHRLLRLGYRQKIKPNKKRSTEWL